MVPTRCTMELRLPGFNWSTGETRTGTKLASYAGDTTIGGYAAQRIDLHLYYEVLGTGEQFSQSAGTVHTRYSEDVVYQWEPWSGQFDTLLWFGAAPGDHWLVWGTDDHYFLATDTATVTVDGIPLRRVAVSMMYPELFGTEPAFYDTLYERIGSSAYSSFEPPHPAADGYDLWFRCYRDDACSYADLGVEDCGFTLATGVADYPGVGDGPICVAYPNPSNGRFNLSYPAQYEAGLLEVLDATGGVVYRSRLAAGSQVHNVPLEGAAAGLYLCRVRWGAQTATTRVLLE